MPPPAIVSDQLPPIIKGSAPLVEMTLWTGRRPALKGEQPTALDLTDGAGAAIVWMDFRISPGAAVAFTVTFVVDPDRKSGMVSKRLTSAQTNRVGTFYGTVWVLYGGQDPRCAGKYQLQILEA